MDLIINISDKDDNTPLHEAKVRQANTPAGRLLTKVVNYVTV